MTLDQIAKQLEKWAWRGKHANKDNLKIEKIENEGRPRVTLTMLTESRSYHIRALPFDDDGVYIACKFSERKPRPGETWKRAGDLSDGNFNETTWNKIVHDILSVELAAAAEDS